MILIEHQQSCLQWLNHHEWWGDAGAEPGHLPDCVQGGRVPPGAGQAPDLRAVWEPHTQWSWWVEENQCSSAVFVEGCVIFYYFTLTNL